MANRLADETSPYLLQHKDNPVDWYPWGAEALERAKAEDKPILLSIGYSACHWCHVMEHESFEDEETAALMNEHFVPVKVDREERPDLDSIYMGAVQAMTGHGGWPLNVFLRPRRRAVLRRHLLPARAAPGHAELPAVLEASPRRGATRRDEIRAAAPRDGRAAERDRARCAPSEDEPLDAAMLRGGRARRSPASSTRARRLRRRAEVPARAARSSS